MEVGIKRRRISSHFNGPGLRDTLADNWFKLIADQSCVQHTNPAYFITQLVFIAQDLSEPRRRYVSVRIVGVQSLADTEASQELKILSNLDTGSVLKHVLSQRETFWHKDKGQGNLCLVYDEMIGPDL